MKILDILNDLSIQYSDYQLKQDLDYYDIDFYNDESVLATNILYYADHYIPTRVRGTILYFGKVPKTDQDYIVVEGQVSDVLRKLHHYFLIHNKERERVIMLMDFLSQTDSYSIKEIARRAAQILNNPVIVTNAAYKVLAIDDAGCQVDDPIFDNAKKYGYCTHESINMFEDEGITTKVVHTKSSIYINTGLARKIPRILSKIVIQDKTVAYIGVLEIKKKLDKNDLYMVDDICLLLKNEMEKDSSILDATNIVYESIIKDLLSQNISPTHLNERLEATLWKTKSYFRCTLITTRVDNKPIENTNYLIHKISESYHIKCIMHDHFILIINNYDHREEWHKQITFIENEASFFGLRVGISNEFRNLENLKTYYKEAKKAIDIASLLHIKDTAFYFAAFLPYYLMDCIDINTLKNLHNVYYERLLAHDQKHNTDYCKTLYYYVLYNSNINKTSTKLCIHRNSLTHRLEKIRDIANIPLEQGVVLQNYILFYQIQLYISRISEQSANKI